MRESRRRVLSWTMAMAVVPFVLGDGWTHLARSPARDAVTYGAPRNLNNLAWVFRLGLDDEFVGPSSPVVTDGRVFANVRHFENNLQTSNRLVAVDALAGSELWNVPIELDALDSWSSPAVDVRNGTVLIGSGSTLHALDTSTGRERWQTRLLPGRLVVNASPVVTSNLVTNGTPSNRVFITDFGTQSATLYAINVDPRDETNNPHDPGEIVWTALLGGASGASPAYKGGRVYVTTVSGEVQAFNARANGAPLWTFRAAAAGFFGGLSIRGAFVYAATYEFNGGENNSRLYKIAANSGELAWEIPCERTSSIPVIVGDRTIYLSGGVHGFGSAVKIQAFADHGERAELLWDTHADTGGALVIGGWSHQPAFSCGMLYAGTLPSEPGFTAYRDLRILDVSLRPTDPGFVVAFDPDAGSSPALASNRIYSIGPNGLFSFAGRGLTCAPPDEVSEPTIAAGRE